MHGAGNVEECLIDRHSLDSRGEVVKDRHHVVAKLLIEAEMSADEKKITAKLAGSPPGHATADAVASGFIRCRQHHSAADGDGSVPQRRVQQLLNRRVEGIEVGMQDRRPPLWRRFHGLQCSRTYVRFSRKAGGGLAGQGCDDRELVV
jgi:hypothetical protein